MRTYANLREHTCIYANLQKFTGMCKNQQEHSFTEKVILITVTSKLSQLLIIKSDGLWA